MSEEERKNLRELVALFLVDVSDGYAIQASMAINDFEKLAALEAAAHWLKCALELSDPNGVHHDKILHDVQFMARGTSHQYAAKEKHKVTLDGLAALP